MTHPFDSHCQRRVHCRSDQRAQTNGAMKKTETVFEASWLPAMVILALGAMVFCPFTGPVLWALILAYATWPTHHSVLWMLNGRAVLRV